MEPFLNEIPNGFERTALVQRVTPWAKAQDERPRRLSFQPTQPKKRTARRAARKKVRLRSHLRSGTRITTNAGTRGTLKEFRCWIGQFRINSKMLLRRYVSKILQIGTFVSDSSSKIFIRNSPETPSNWRQTFFLNALSNGFAEYLNGMLKRP